MSRETFTCTGPALAPFRENAETTRMTLWDGRAEIGDVCEIDAALIGFG